MCVALSADRPVSLVFCSVGISSPKFLLVLLIRHHFIYQPVGQRIQCIVPSMDLLNISPSMYGFTDMCNYLSTDVSICASVNLLSSLYLHMHLSLYVSMCLSIYLWTYTFTCRSINGVRYSSIYSCMVVVISEAICLLIFLSNR